MPASSPPIASPLKIATTATADAPANQRYQYSCNMVGGTTGYVVPNLWVNTYVGTGATGNFIWGLLSQMQSSSTSGEHVAIYGQNSKQVGGTAPCWAACFEGRDDSGSPSSVSGSLVSVEIDSFVNGADDAVKRVGLDMVVGYATSAANGGAAPEVAYGIRVSGANGDTTAKVQRAFSVLSSYSVAAFDASLGHAVNNAPGLMLAANQRISFDTANSHQLYFNSGGALQYYHGGSVLLEIFDSGTSHIFTPLGVRGSSGGITLNPLGTGATLVVDGTAGSSLSIGTASGTALKLIDATSAANYVTVTPAATGADPVISVAGDTDRNLVIQPAGSGTLYLKSKTYLGQGSSNWVSAAGAAVGSSPTVSALGTDTNIGLTLAGKGNNGVLAAIYTNASDPTTTSIPAGFCAVWNNTTAGTFKLYANVGGTLRSVALA